MGDLAAGERPAGDGGYPDGQRRDGGGSDRRAADSARHDGGPFVVTCTADQPSPEAELPAGPHPGGGFVLPGGRLLEPAGQEIALGGFPLSLRLSPSGRHLLVSDGAYAEERLRVLRTDSRQLVTERTLDAMFLGLVVTPSGRVYVSGGGGSGRNDAEGRPIEQIHVFDLDDRTGTLTELPPLQVRAQLASCKSCPQYPAGMALAPDGHHLLVALNLGDALAVLDPDDPNEPEVGRAPIGFATYPYDVQVAPSSSGRLEAYVSEWGDDRVAVVDIADLAWPQVEAHIEVGKNPSGMLLTADGQRLLVAESDSDSLAVIDVAGRRLERSVSVAPVASSARGSSPNALAFSPDATRLYLANAGENAVEVLDAASLTRLGRIPVGNYPTAVLATADAVWVANAKGSGVKLPPPDARPSRPRNAPPAPDGSASRPPPPSRAFPAVHLLGGTLSVVPTPSLSELADGTAAVAANNGRPALLTPALRCRPGQPPRFPLPLSAGQPTPIEHVMLLVRENKTYDAELGDLGRGNGDPNLTLFGERLTPNLHKLAREFALLDNFYSDAEASLQGHMWTTAAVANDFTEKAWLTTWGRGTRSVAAFVQDVAAPQLGFVWHHLMAAGVPFVNWGEGVGVTYGIGAPIDFSFPGIVWNLDITDVTKAKYVVERIVHDHYFPRFAYLLLPNNHTYGTTPGKPTPESMIADNDEATGRVVDAISHSSFWPSSIIFIIEDDPQGGTDHVEAHRSPCIVVSPWVKRGHVSSLQASNPSLWRTIALLLGIPPISQQAQTASAMVDLFAEQPDLRPYTLAPRQVAEARNPADAPFAAESRRMDFSQPDQAPGLNRLLWRVMRGGEPPWEEPEDD